jgi:hypothetical protein
LYFSLSSLPCVSKAASSAPKSKAKLLAMGCYAVLTELFSDKARKNMKGIPVGIAKGFSAALAEKSLTKPIVVRFPSA